MKRLLVLIIFLASSCLQAQQRFPVYLDGAQFMEDEFSNRVEFYYSIPDTIMTYKPKDGKFYGEAFFMLELQAQNEKPVYVKWVVNNYSPTAKIASPGLLTSQKNIVMNKGEYTCKLYVYDFADTSRNVVLPFNLKVIPFSKDAIQISNAELVHSFQTIEQAGAARNQQLDKVGKNIIPITNSVVNGDSANTTSAHFYTEIYNLGKRAPEGFKLIYSLCNDSTEVLTFDKLAKTSSNAIPDIVSVPLEYLQSGYYRMYIKTLYPAPKYSDTLSTAKDFYFYNPTMPPLATSLVPVEFEQSEFAALTKGQIADEILLAKYFGTELEVAKIEMLKDDLVAVRKALFDFWIAVQARTPERPNLRKSVQDNIAYANLNFAFSSVQKGWKTDRGRVYVKYGKFTRRNIHEPRQLQNAYEEWVYDAYMGGLTFYFVDKDNVGNYKLVHCTPAVGTEVYNENWYKMFVTPRKQDINGSPTNGVSLPTFGD